jgi:hypothetical protein
MARAAARHVAKQRSGVIIFLVGSPRAVTSKVRQYRRGVRCNRISDRKPCDQLGPVGVRAIKDTVAASARAMNVSKDQMIAQLRMNFLKVPVSVFDTAKAAVFIASDRECLVVGNRCKLNGR